MRKMATILMTLIGILSSGFTTANERPIPYQSLYGIQESLRLNGIDVEGIVDVTQTRLWGIVSNPYAIKLKIHALSACGDNILVMNQNSVLRFFQIGSLGPHVQPGCFDAIEYYLAPNPGIMKAGESKYVTTYFGGSVYSQPNYLISITALVTQQFGDLPSGKGRGYYYTYSDVSLKEHK
ncbi:MAG: hypothetical protein KDD61_00065 [Bdellovibrionales bacterium]|nr:hypothetical protein [Bdellovibrionales bacterium]